MTQAPANAIGYCAVVLPAIDEWQGIYIVDTPEVQQAAELLKQSALATAVMANPYGAIQAVLVEGFLKKNNGALAAAALALKQLSGHSYFRIRARVEVNGTRTELIALKANSIDQARNEIESLPEVREIKQRLGDKLSMRDGLGRRRGFH